MSFVIATALFGVMSYGAGLPVSQTTVIPVDAYSQSADDELQIPMDPAPPLPAGDRRFLTTAAQDNLVVIAAARLLTERGSDPALRRMGHELLDQRVALQDALEVVAIRKDETLPRQMSATATATLARVASLPDGDAFDREWLREYGNVSQRAATQFSLTQRRLLHNQDVREFAAAQAAMLRNQVITAPAAALLETASNCACSQ